MKHKFIPLTLALVTVLVSTYLIAPEWFFLCESHDRGDSVFVCSSPYSNMVGFPLLYLASSLTITSFIGLFISSTTFSRWVKFSIWYAVVIAILLITVPSIGAGAGGFGLTYIDTQGFAVFYAVLYAIISAILFAVSEFLLRKNR